MSTLIETHPDLAAQWSPRNAGGPDTVSRGSHKKVWWVGPCGHEWEAVVKNRAMNGTGCGYCSPYRKRTLPGFNDLATKFPDLAAQWSPRNTEPASSVTPSSVKNVWWVGSCGHEWQASPNNRTRGTGCPQCTGKVVVPGETDLATLSPTLAGEWSDRNVLNPGAVTGRSSRRAWWECERGHSWEARIVDRVDGSGCRQCSGSGPETEIATHLRDLGLEVVRNDRTLLKGAEVDILVPGRLAVEFNGVYWHSDRFKDREYHSRKCDLAVRSGVQLVHVWEDDWRDRKEVVMRMLARKANASQEPRLNARSLQLVTLTPEEAREFFTENHLQGFTRSSSYFGLSDGVVRAALAMKATGAPGEYTLTRYATSALVRGGHSRLFKHAVKTLNATRVVTFADRGVSDGGLYETCGFSKDGELPPDYMYVVRGRREHKFNYRKARFKRDPNLKFEEGLTERELAEINGLWRIYDAGKIRYVWDEVE